VNDVDVVDSAGCPVNLYSYLVIVSLYHAHVNVVFDVVILAQLVGEVICSDAGIDTLKSKYFHVITLLLESNIVTVNLYLHVERSFSVKFHAVDLDVQV
jgi:hypothetical protein